MTAVAASQPKLAVREEFPAERVESGSDCDTVWVHRQRPERHQALTTALHAVRGDRFILRTQARCLYTATSQQLLARPTSQKPENGGAYPAESTREESF